MLARKIFRASGQFGSVAPAKHPAGAEAITVRG
jgi:hypothetical protein